MKSSNENLRPKGRSCDACHQRKIYCDSTSASGSSQCDWCKHQGLLCTFNRPFGRRKRSRQAVSVSKTQRSIDVTARDVGYDITATSPTDNSSIHSFPLSPLDARPSEPKKTRASGPTEREAQTIPSLGLGGFYFDGFHLGGISSNHGIPFFSVEGEAWIFAHTGFAPQSANFRAAHASFQIKGAWQLPDKHIVITYFSAFKSSAKRLVFPIVNESSFMDTVEKAYDNMEDQTTPEVICAKACILAFTCVMVHMEGEIDRPQGVQAQQCAARAHSFMPEILVNPSIESIQVCTMLCMYNIFSGNVAMAATYLSIAYRFISMFGAHISAPSITPPSLDLGHAAPRSYLRRVFWNCYMYDKDICLRAGYPPIIDDDHCDLTLPPGYKQIDDFDTFGDGSDLIPGDMRLTIIKSKMIRELYCAKSFQSSEVELLKDIRELDDELETWRMSIPPQYRPQLSSSYHIKLESDWNRSKKIHVVVIHFEYYFLLALIHSASGRCRIRAFDEMDPQASLSSCQALALQASRSILANLAKVAEVFNGGDFWFFVSYPMFASLTIFCNILLSPLNAQAEDDLGLLRQVPTLVRQMSAVPVGPADGMRLMQVQQFVEDLLRLGRSAVDKAYADDSLTI